MVNCYCGCDTRGNRIKFAVSAILYLLGAIMMMRATTMSAMCNTEASEECQIIEMNGDDEAFEKYNCEEVNQEFGDCIQSPEFLKVSMVVLFGELLMILATVPLCVLCCCTKKPPPQEALIQAPTALHQGAHYDRI